MKARYRIMQDRWLGYEVQIWRWWFPLWVQADWANTHPTLEMAEEFALRHAGAGDVVRDLGWL